MIKILIVDDHMLIREGFKRLIRREADMEIAGEAESAEEALQFLDRNNCDIIILDIGLPGKNGLELLSDLRQKNSGLKVLMMTMHSEEIFASRALKSNAQGYLAKERAPNELVPAIRQILGGEIYFG